MQKKPNVCIGTTSLEQEIDFAKKIEAVFPNCKFIYNRGNINFKVEFPTFEEYVKRFATKSRAQLAVHYNKVTNDPHPFVMYYTPEYIEARKQSKTYTGNVDKYTEYLDDPQRYYTKISENITVPYLFIPCTINGINLEHLTIIVVDNVKQLFIYFDPWGPHGIANQYFETILNQVADIFNYLTKSKYSVIINTYGVQEHMPICTYYSFLFVFLYADMKDFDKVVSMMMNPDRIIDKLKLFHRFMSSNIPKETNEIKCDVSTPPSPDYLNLNLLTNMEQLHCLFQKKRVFAIVNENSLNKYIGKYNPDLKPGVKVLQQLNNPLCLVYRPEGGSIISILEMVKNQNDPDIGDPFENVLVLGFLLGFRGTGYNYNEIQFKNRKVDVESDKLLFPVNMQEADARKLKSQIAKRSNDVRWYIAVHIENTNRLFDAYKFFPNYKVINIGAIKKLRDVYKIDMQKITPFSI